MTDIDHGGLDMALIPATLGSMLYAQALEPSTLGSTPAKPGRSSGGVVQ